MSIAPNDANIVYSPYNWDVTSGRALSVNPGAYFRCEIQGTPTAISATFDMSGVSGPFPEILYRVDEGPWTTATTAASVALTIPGTNSYTKHLVEIVVKWTAQTNLRWTGGDSVVKFTGFTTTPGTCTTVPIYKSSLNIVVFGDSITEAYQSLSSSSSDATRGYAFMLRQHLGAEVGVVGFGGQGWTHTGNGGVPVFPSTWNLICSGISRDFTTVPPDMIVIVHGQNDSSSVTTDATSTLAAILAATAATTKVAIVRPFSGAHASELQSVVTAAASLRVAYIDSTGWFSSADANDGVHPYGYTHVGQLAPLLAAQLRPFLNRGGTYLKIAGAAKRVDTLRV